MQRANKLHVVGIGYRPLGTRASELVGSAKVLLASNRLAEVFKRYAEYDTVKDRIKIINRVPDTIAFIREWFERAEPRTPNSELSSLVLLASGDPLFFGIGRRMIAEFGESRVDILPDLSSMQEAFARINETWDDAVFISLHGGPDIAKRRTLPYEIKDIPMLLERTGKMGVLTDRENNPAMIARVLNSELRTQNSELVMHVCEHLGYPDERIVTGTPDEIAKGTFADPNVVIITRTENMAWKISRPPGTQKIDTRFGLREDEIEHERGLITKDEVRAVTLHKLRLPNEGVLWDIGAGSGSVSLEAARLCPALRVFAVERDANRVGMIRENVERYTARNVSIVQGSAPDSLAELPAPNRVFIGGSGGRLGEVVSLISDRMNAGIVVINAITLETLNEAISALEGNGFSVEISEISVSRSKDLAGRRQMSALNPVFIVQGTRE